jgi:SAM-dependent methyltransferase
MNELQVLDMEPRSVEDSLLVSDYIKKKFAGEIKILEAGCGRRWELDLKDVKYELTGLDLSQEAVEIRKNQLNDLDKTLIGDIRTIQLKDGEYDVIYSSYVLEHVKGAEKALDNFFRWLKPKGILILRIPDSSTAYGFLSKYSPFWFHVFYKKYIAGDANAGKPGHDPFPTFYDSVISRKGIHTYCQRHGLKIRMEYSYTIKKSKPFYPIGYFALKILGVISFGKLTSNRGDLVYVIEKPE